MHVKIDEKTKQITHIHLARFRQGVADEQLYLCLDPKPADRALPASTAKRHDAGESGVSQKALQDEKSAYIERLRGEFNRLESLVTQAQTIEDLQAIKPGFPVNSASPR